MRRRKGADMRKFALFLLFFLLLTPALAEEPRADVSFAEPFSDERLSTAPGFLVQTDRAEYRFSPEIDQEARERFVSRQEALLEKLNEGGFALYVLPDYPGRSEGRSLYLSPEDETGLTQAALTLQSLYGPRAHFGLLFGAADELCREAGLPGYRRRFNEKGMLRFYNDDENLAYFLLSYPCFTEAFTAKGAIPYVKDMAVRVYEFARERMDVSAFLKETDLEAAQRAYLALINDFLSAQEAENRLHDDLPALAFACGGRECPLIIFSAHGEWDWLKDFDEPISYLLWEGDFSSMYSALWQMEDEMTRVDEALKLPSPEPLRFILCAQGAYGLKSNYQHEPKDGTMALCTVTSLIHTYVHARFEGAFTGENAWFLSELAATYFEMQSDMNALDRWYSRLWGGDSLDASWDAVADAMYDGKIIGYWSGADKIFGYYCFVNERYDLYTPSSLTLNALRSFSGYLKEFYGDEKVAAALISQNPAEALGKDWEQLRLEWKKHLEALYGEGAAA